MTVKPVSIFFEYQRTESPGTVKSPGSNSEAFAGWPGQLACPGARARHCECTGGSRNSRGSTGGLLWPSATRTTSCPGHQRKTSRSKLRGIPPKRLTESHSADSPDSVIFFSSSTTGLGLQKNRFRGREIGSKIAVSPPQ